MKISNNIAISESGFIFHPGTGDSFTTNQAGLEIINLLKEDKNREEILQAMCEQFAVDEATLDKDLVDFLMMLDSYQLLKNNE